MSDRWNELIFVLMIIYGDFIFVRPLSTLT